MIINTQTIQELFDTQSGYFISKQTGIPQSTINRLQQGSKDKIKMKDAIPLMHLADEVKGLYSITKHDILTINEGMAEVKRIGPDQQEAQLVHIPLNTIARLSFFYNDQHWEDEHASLLNDMDSETGRDDSGLAEYLAAEEETWGENKTYFTKEGLGFLNHKPFVVIHAIAEGDPDNNRRELFVNLDLIMTENDLADMINEVISDVNLKMSPQGLQPAMEVVGFDERTQPAPLEGVAERTHEFLNYDLDKHSAVKVGSEIKIRQCNKAISEIEEQFGDTVMPDDARQELERIIGIREAALERLAERKIITDRLNYRLDRLDKEVVIGSLFNVGGRGGVTISESIRTKRGKLSALEFREAAYRQHLSGDKPIEGLTDDDVEVRLSSVKEQIENYQKQLEFLSGYKEQLDNFEKNNL